VSSTDRLFGDEVGQVDGRVLTLGQLASAEHHVTQQLIHVRLFVSDVLHQCHQKLYPHTHTHTHARTHSVIINGPPTHSVGGKTSHGRWCLSSSSVTRRLCNVTHQGPASGGPVVLRPVRATSCYPHIRIGKVWIYRLLFAFLFVCFYGYGFLRRR